ncbi:MAG: hydroxyacid dehydrogenase [Lachnospiraceae bacterium]|nr:hydroxyacid dehydrogenase [Lachnospiraceae bacterium]
MKNVKIAVLDSATLGEDLDLSALKDYGEFFAYKTTAPEEVCDHLKDAEVALINKVKMNEKTLAGNDSLKLICIAATGFDNVDLDYCKKKGIAVCNVAGYSTESVAQLTAAMALYLSTNIYDFTEHVRSGEYTKGGVANKLTPVYHEISGKTWGIVGYGNIGKKVGDVARALGCKVLAFKKTPATDVECVDLKTLCAQSDIISVHLPLNDSTRGIISSELISSMKKDAILINVARGAVCDEAAVAKAIKDGKIAGLGCDVYSSEPFPETHPFNEIKEYRNVCLTPHMAWGSYEARKRCLNEICMNIRSFYEGGNRSRLV